MAEDSNIILAFIFIELESHDELERRVKKHQQKNIQHLQVLFKDEWNQIEPTVFQKLVDSVPNRLQEYIKMKGDIKVLVLLVFRDTKKKILIGESIIFGHENSIHNQ